MTAATWITSNSLSGAPLKQAGQRRNKQGLRTGATFWHLLAAQLYGGVSLYLTDMYDEHYTECATGRRCCAFRHKECLNDRKLTIKMGDYTLKCAAN